MSQGSTTKEKRALHNDAKKEQLKEAETDIQDYFQLAYKMADEVTDANKRARKFKANSDMLKSRVLQMSKQLCKHQNAVASLQKEILHSKVDASEFHDKVEQLVV